VRPGLSRRTSTLVAVLVLAPLCHCSKDDGAPSVRKTRTLGVQAGHAAASPAPAAPSEAVERPTEPAPNEHVVIEAPDSSTISFTVKVKVDGAARKEDPDLAVVAAGRAAGAACFTNITDGSPSRSATIHLTVLPSGTVNRSEVTSAGTTEAWILTCLEGVGNGLHFSDRPAADIRTYSIDVTVTLAH